MRLDFSEMRKNYQVDQLRQKRLNAFKPFNSPVMPKARKQKGIKIAKIS